MFVLLHLKLPFRLSDAVRDRISCLLAGFLVIPIPYPVASIAKHYVPEDTSKDASHHIRAATAGVQRALTSNGI